MLTFKQYLLETKPNIVSTWSSPISVDDAVAILKTKCSRTLAKGNVFFRGGPQNWLEYGKTGNEPRASANTFNYYTLFLDNSEAWQDYPKRSSSFVCSTTAHGAFNKGRNSPHIVIPFDGTKYAVAPERDFWFSFRNTFKHGNVERLTSSTHDIIKFYIACEDLLKHGHFEWDDVKQKADKVNTIEKFKDAANLITFSYVRDMEEKINNEYADKLEQKKLSLLKLQVDDFMRVELENYGSLWKIYAKVFDPLRNGFVIGRAGSTALPVDDDNGTCKEAWFSGECLFISHPALVRANSHDDIGGTVVFDPNRESNVTVDMYKIIDTLRDLCDDYEELFGL
jgi:hypothetical protein